MITEFISLCIASYFVNGCNVYENYKIKKVFNYLDIDGDGQISYQEFGKWLEEDDPELVKKMTGNGQNKIEDIIRVIVADGDDDDNGQINFEEFKKIILSVNT
jgi:Ca2+-binding EF-hand superfamily protein